MSAYTVDSALIKSALRSGMGALDISSFLRNLLYKQSALREISLENHG